MYLHQRELAGCLENSFSLAIFDKDLQETLCLDYHHRANLKNTNNDSKIKCKNNQITWKNSLSIYWSLMVLVSLIYCINSPERWGDTVLFVDCADWIDGLFINRVIRSVIGSINEMKINLKNKKSVVHFVEGEGRQWRHGVTGGHDPYSPWC